MQGPRLPSHSNPDDLPEVLFAPKNRRNINSYSSPPIEIEKETERERQQHQGQDAPSIKAENSGIEDGGGGAGRGGGGGTNSSKRRGVNKAIQALKRHLGFIGPGVIASVAYIDPGNWSTDLQAGSQVGLSLMRSLRGGPS